MKFIIKVTLMSLLDSQCFQNNLDYYGNDVAFVSASSPKHCQKECQDNKDCGVWTYRKEQNSKGQNCWLKRDNNIDTTPSPNNNYKVWKKDRISGPKYCGK